MKKLFIKLFSNQKTLLVILAMIIGILLGLYVKYPVSIDKIQHYQKICQPKSEIKSVKVSVSGDIFEITCKDNSIHKIKN